MLVPDGSVSAAMAGDNHVRRITRIPFANDDAASRKLFSRQVQAAPQEGLSFALQLEHALVSLVGLRCGRARNDVPEAVRDSDTCGGIIDWDDRTGCRAFHDDVGIAVLAERSLARHDFVEDCA